MILYKYIKLDDAIIESLVKAYFRFTQFSYLNDKFEGNYGNDYNEVTSEKFIEYLIEFTNRHPNNRLASSKEIIECMSIYPSLKFNPRNVPGLYSGSIAEKTELKGQYVSALKEEIDIKLKKLCIFSLSKQLNNLLMWSHYANQESGIIIGFDSHHPFFSSVKPIMYSNNRETLTKIQENYLSKEGIRSSEVDRFINNAILTKCKCWKYEREYRLIKSIDECDKKVNDNSEDILLFSIPFHAWTSVFFGPNSNKQYEKILFLVLSKQKECSHIKLINVFRNQDKYGYNSVIRNT